MLIELHKSQFVVLPELQKAIKTTKEKPEPASLKSPFHIKTGSGHKAVKDGIKVSIHPDIPTFLHKTVGESTGYAVSEARSGSLISNGNTPEDAVEKARRAINKYGADKINQLAGKLVKTEGISPKYQPANDGSTYDHLLDKNEYKEMAKPRKRAIQKAFSMLVTDLQKAITRKQATSLHKDLPPGGEWRTMSGHHIYILNGKVLAGSIPGVTDKPKKATKAQLSGHQTAISNAKQLATNAKIKAGIEEILATSNNNKKKPKVDIKEHMAKQRAEVDEMLGVKNPAKTPEKTAKVPVDKKTKVTTTKVKTPVVVKPDPKKKNTKKEATGGKAVPLDVPKAEVKPTKPKAPPKTAPAPKKPANGGKAEKLVIPSEDVKPKKPRAKKVAPEVADIRHDAQKNKKVAYDVGDKIGNAKKDKAYWHDRFKLSPTVSTLEEIEKVDPAWANTVVTKDNVLPKTGGDEWFKTEEAKGGDFRSTWMKSYIFGKIAKKPEESPQARKAYVESCNHLYAVLEPLGTEEKVLSAMKDMSQWMSYEDPKARVKRLKELIAMRKEDMKLGDKELVEKQHYVQNAFWTIDRLAPLARKRAQESIDKYTSEMKSLKGTPENAFYKFRALGDDFTKLFTRGASWENFKNAYEKKPKNWEGHWGKKEISKGAEKKESAVRVKWERQMPAKVTRVGGKKVSIDKPEQLVKDFGFRGVEFGNWVDDHSGNFHLTKATEALTDLADILGINQKQVSFNGRLGLAFGARGKGRALAHYEPDMTVINLTKEGGTGSLGHEWAHALDHAVCAFGRGMFTGHFASDGHTSNLPEEVQKAYSNLMNAMKDGEGLYPYEITEETLNNFRYRASSSLIRRYEEHGKDIEKLLASDRKRYGDHIASSTRGYMQTASGTKARDALAFKLKRRYKLELEETAKLLIKHEKEVTGKFSGGCMVPGFNSQFLQNSLSYERGGKKYWSDPIEMFARGFESYLQDKLTEKGRQNDYLVYDTKGKALNSPYPHGEERTKLNGHYDTLIEMLHSSGTLKKALEFSLQKGIDDDVFYNISEEGKAIMDYEKLLTKVKDPRIKEVIKEILADEKSHKHNLDCIIRYIDGDKDALKILQKAFITQEDLLTSYPRPSYNRNAYNIESDEGVFYIPLNRLEFPYQTEQATDFDKVYSNVMRMKSGENLDPIIIGYGYDVHDGHHRVEASRIMQYSHVPCIVGGNNDLEVAQARERYGELWKSFALEGLDKEAILVLKSMGGHYDINNNAWTITIDSQSNDFKWLANIAKTSNIILKEL